MNICLDTIYKYAKFSECVKFLIHWFKKNGYCIKSIYFEESPFYTGYLSKMLVYEAVDTQ